MTNTTDLVSTARPGRRADESMREFLDELRLARPELFTERRLDEIINEVEEYAPRATRRDSFRLSIQAYMSAVTPMRRQPSKAIPREPAEERDARLLTEVATDLRLILGSIGPHTVIGDRPLGDWTIGELRALGGLFASILEVAGEGSDDRLVRTVMKPKHWRRLRRQGKA